MVVGAQSFHTVHMHCPPSVRCSCNDFPLGGMSWLTLTAENEHCNTGGIKKMTSWFYPLVGKSMCICEPYVCVSASERAHTAECNISFNGRMLCV